MSQSSPAAAAGDLPELLLSTVEDPLPWRLLHILNLFHMVVGGLVVALYFSGGRPPLLGDTNPSLFLWTGIVYFSFSALASFSVRARRPAFSVQAYTQLGADIVAVALLMYSSGGASSGLGGLLFVSIAINSVIVSQRASIAFAALATLVILGEQSFSVLYGSAIPGGYTQAGITGVILFIAAVVGHYLGQRLRESEALAVRRGVDLRNLAQLNEYIIRRMRTGVVVVDDADRVRLVNEAGLAGFSRHPGDTPHIQQLSPRLKQALDAWRRDGQLHATVFTSEDGKPIIPHFTQLAPGSNSGTLIFLEDPSLLNEQVRQMKLAALGRLTGSIAHEIRNPLTAISHANQLLAESPVIRGNDRRLTEIIAEHALRMDRIVETILQLSRRDSVRAEELELTGWLRDFAAEFRDRQGLDDAALAVQVQTDGGMRVRMDPGHLHQVLWNLAENALRYGQPPAVTTAPGIELRIGRRPAPGTVELDVLDHGPGVPREIAEHIFEPFYTSSPRGTGLGLFIARELCECNHARLVYEPRAEGGSCFRILFGTSESWLT
ncbi:MAG: HAMP domain-containing histidine kinase [Gammaproteobacteria bacterium]|nr:HAMP domain-containing histidine kinase [Gammaproteobacteria bacterium]